MNGRPFLPPTGSFPALPLDRFLPPVDRGMVTAWVKTFVPPGSMVIDPLGASPWISIELARAGYSVMTACASPVLQNLLCVAARAPSAADFQSALADLASSRRGSDRLENSLRRLYASECAMCGQRVEVDEFLWHKDQTNPYAKIYRCASCGDSGEKPVSPIDQQVLANLGSDVLHRARALQRVTGGKEAPAGLSEALNVYPPRSLDFLFTAVNKIEGLSLSSERKDLLYALLLRVCEQGSSLWDTEGSRQRPRQISIPSVFREVNLWKVLEKTASTWEQSSPPVPLTTYPTMPSKPGICLYPGRFRSLAAQIEPGQIRSAVCLFPRPNQAFWTLSAVWAGWLWGADAAQGLASALERRRYSWQWHTRAVFSVLSALKQTLSPDSQVFGLVPEANPGFVGAVLTAAQQSGFTLQHLAVRGESEIAQISWSAGELDSRVLERSPEKAAVQTLQDVLLNRAEPTDHLTCYTAGFAAAVRTEKPVDVTPEKAVDQFNRVQIILSDMAQKKHIFMRLAANKNNPVNEFSPWWLASPPNDLAMPLADRVEMAVVRRLQQPPALTMTELEALICSQFPGLATPPGGLILKCVESYAEINPGSGEIRIRNEDTSANRRTELREIGHLLFQMVQKIARVEEVEDCLQVIGPDGAVQYEFHLLASAVISRFVHLPPPSAEVERYLVIPASRLDLIEEKIRRDPRLAAAISGWQFLKFRTVRQLAERSDLTWNGFFEALSADPPQWARVTQMSLLL